MSPTISCFIHFGCIVDSWGSRICHFKSFGNFFSQCIICFRSINNFYTSFLCLSVESKSSYFKFSFRRMNFLPIKKSPYASFLTFLSYRVPNHYIDLYVSQPIALVLEKSYYSYSHTILTKRPQNY